MEIKELEELISLQRRKVDLLKEKQEILAESGFTGKVKDECVDSPIILVSTSRPSTASSFEMDTGRESVVRRDHTSLLDTLRQSIIGDDVTHLKGHDGNEDDHESAGVVQEKEEVTFVDSLTRLSRLTTDLANERNLLAWGRTALASARTCLAFMAVEGTGMFGHISGKVMVLGFAFFAFVIMFTGYQRFKTIKYIIGLKNPPASFHRLTNSPTFICLILLFLLAFIVVCAGDWRRE